MRSCKECLQQSLPINIFARLVVSKISKHKSYKFGLWKISYYILCIEVKRAPKRADPGLGKMMCLSNYYMQPAYDPVRGPLSVFDSSDCFSAHSTMSVSGFAMGRPNMCVYMTYLTKILLILPFAAIFEGVKIS